MYLKQSGQFALNECEAVLTNCDNRFGHC